MTVPFSIATHNGIITILNPATGQHRTVKISTAKDGARFAAMLIGSDNENDYLPFAVFVDGSLRVFKKIKDGRDGRFYKSLAAMLNEPERFVGRVEFSFAGRCMKCNRLLTDPISIACGMGPECRKQKTRHDLT